MECGHENIELRNQNGPLVNKYSFVAAKEQQTMRMARCILPRPRISAAAIVDTHLKEGGCSDGCRASDPIVRKVAAVIAARCFSNFFPPHKKYTRTRWAPWRMKKMPPKGNKVKRRDAITSWWIINKKT